MNYKKGIPRGYLFYFARRRLGYPFVISTLPPFVISTNVEKSRSDSDGQKGIDRAIQSDFSTALEMTGGANGLPPAAARSK